MSVALHQLEHHQLETNGVRLHVVQAGPRSGRIAILLHGFPECWIAWANQIDALAAAGYRVWIPDQRGYNTSDKPRGVKSYAEDILVEDIRGLIEIAAQEPVFLLGHDWGGAIAWRLANRYPEIIDRLVILNCPHFSVFQQRLSSSLMQLLKSWYIFFFQIPKLPEYFLGRKNYSILVEALCSRSRQGSFSEQEIEIYRQAWKQPGALTAMLNWYRAVFRAPSKPTRTPRVRVPTLVVWGAKDHALGRDMAQPSIDLCDEGQLVLIEEAGHWVLQEESRRVNELVCEFLAKESNLAFNRTRKSGAPVN